MVRLDASPPRFCCWRMCRVTRWDGPTAWLLTCCLGGRCTEAPLPAAAEAGRCLLLDGRADCCSSVPTVSDMVMQPAMCTSQRQGLCFVSDQRASVKAALQALNSSTAPGVDRPNVSAERSAVQHRPLVGIPATTPEATVPM